MTRNLITEYGDRRGQSGMTLVESLVAIAIIAAIAVIFLGGLVVSSNASVITDEQATAESLARSQMEWVQSVAYSENYTPTAVLAISDYQNYSVTIEAEPLHDPDDGIQRITVTVARGSVNITSLEGYKRR